MMASQGQSLEEYKQRAQAAEEENKILKERIKSLEAKVNDAEQKSNLIKGATSTMGDNIQLSLRSLMERGVRCQPNVEIVTRIEGGKYHRITYAEAQKRAVRVASALTKLGVEIGDRVATLMYNNSRHLILYYAIPSMGSGIFIPDQHNYTQYNRYISHSTAYSQHSTCKQRFGIHYQPRTGQNNFRR